MNLKMLADENYHQYIWRLDNLIKSGKYRNWKEITPIVNIELFGDDESQYRDESAYRKAAKYARDFYEAGVFSISEDEYLEELKVQKQELAKEKVKIRDERNELNRIIRTEARKESYADMIKRVVCENVEPIAIDKSTSICSTSDNDLLCHLTDIHTGIEIDNWKNFFNQDVLKHRIEQYTYKVIDIKNLHKSQNCHLVIGEIISGLIHNNLRLQNNLNLMEQFKYASELISTMLVELSNHFEDIFVYVTPGNHSRISQKKEDALDGENMDLLLPFYLKARLQNIDNVVICENTIEPEIAMFNVRGNKVFSSHGHKDKASNVVQNFTMMFGIKPDIVLLGHRHTNGLTTVYDTKVIESGCVSGIDQYAVSIRKANKPEQTVSVINEDGLVCLYDIQLCD